MKSRFIVVGSMLLAAISVILYQEYINKDEVISLNGVTMGIINYNIKYVGKSMYPCNANMYPCNHKIDSVLEVFNESLSTYIPNSEISTLNTTGSLKYPSILFEDVMTTSLVVWEQTEGTFDPTIGPIVNKWGFGPDKTIVSVDSAEINDLLDQVGFEKINKRNKSYHMDTSMYLDFSAIAKGYAVDLVAQFLENNAVYNYMVEIGGEVRTRGNSLNHTPWRIGIENPLVEQDEQKLFAVVNMNTLSMATSGNYRNYYEKEGRLIAHTIDPRTGFSTDHSLLSATVFTKKCTEADAYATACMVLGVQESIKLSKKANFDIFLIFTNAQGAIETYVSSGMKDKISEINKGS
jgi:thiamine biosynthesis lipoprotein